MSAGPMAGDTLTQAFSRTRDNATWHAAPGPLWLDVEAEPGHVTVGVTDPGGGEVQLAPDSRWPETGQGLKLVAALSARWGVEPAAQPPGKRVWFEVATEQRGGEPAAAARHSSRVAHACPEVDAPPTASA